VPANGSASMPASEKVSCTQPTEPFHTARDVAGMNESQKSDRNGPVTTDCAYSTPSVS
jgi:hypothetical protein